MPEQDDSRDARFSQISDELRALQEQLVNASGNYSNPANQFDPDNNLWDNSAEAKQVQDIETALWQRVEQWESQLTSNDYGDNGTPFPAWWTTERKKENAIIDQWNRREAQRWLDVSNAYHAELKAIFDKVAALETENEQLGQQGDTENMLYLMNKQQLLLFRLLVALLH